MNILLMVLCVALFPILSPAVHAAEKAYALMNGMQLPFYVYKSYKAPENHYSPSGWMGDFRDLKFTDRYVDPKNPKGKTVIQIIYTGKSSQGQGWTGIYWQNPQNNWGTQPGGFNLNGASRLVFLARGEKGGEVVEFKMGGISGNYADSGTAAVGPINLTKEWKEYRISLEGQELSSISGGFCWTMAKEQNPEGATFYLDNIRYE